MDDGIRPRRLGGRDPHTTVLTSTPTDFRLHAQLDAYEHDERVFAHTWRLTIPRDLV